MTDFLAVQQGHPCKLGSGKGRKPSYRPFTRILAGDLYPPGAYQYSADLRIRFRSHVLPEAHHLFEVMTARELIAYELHGPCPLEPMSCCGRLIAHIPIGDTVDDLRYAPDTLKMSNHIRACLDRMVRERPLGAVPRQKTRSNRSGVRMRHVGDASDWGSETRETIPLLGVNETCTPKAGDSPKD